MANAENRADHKIISDWINSRSSVLDLGCGDGELLAWLVQEKNIHAQGIEIDEEAIYRCVAKGLSVIHADIDSGLSEYRDKAFDYVILNQSLQQVKHFANVFNDALRVGKKVIVGLPNFAYWRGRLQLCFAGHAPVTPSLPHTWYDSPNVHFFSISDFLDYCRAQNVIIEGAAYLEENKRVWFAPNLLATTGIILVSR